VAALVTQCPGISGNAGQQRFNRHRLWLFLLGGFQP
tara:strand:- start:123 stop:230 length:108 start_codon:yes stop_codon:yes gene_type:complete